jgi:tRNA(Ile)-lysidine synthase
LADARRLFADWKDVPAVVLAVSGGPDSTALMWLAARWRHSLTRGPRLLAVTVDHGLRRESAAEARMVQRLAKTLAVEHRIMRWRGPKPATGLPAAARDARYRLLSRAAAEIGAAHILTAHTRDDQAETLMMRLARGSGVFGLAAMARHAPRGSVAIGRPLLDIPKARLIATLRKADIAYAEDPTNHDVAFTRARLRQLMPELAREGIDARNLARLAQRLARANAALEATVGIMETTIGRVRADRVIEIDARAFATLPDEIALRLLGRAVATVATEGTVELAKLEALFADVRTASGRKVAARMRQTLAGALVSVSADVIAVEPAPARRRPPQARRR